MRSAVRAEITGAVAEWTVTMRVTIVFEVSTQERNIRDPHLVCEAIPFTTMLTAANGELKAEGHTFRLKLVEVKWAC